MSRYFVLFLCLALCFLTLLFEIMRYQPDPTYLIMGSGLGGGSGTWSVCLF